MVLDRRQVVAASAAALAAGVRPGMRRAGVQAICPDAMLHEQSATREQAALDAIAQALLQYTPEVALAEEESLLLDLSASLRAFGGRLALSRLVRATVLALGFTPCLGMAPTAQGAWLLARRPERRRRTAALGTLVRQLDALPCRLLPALRPHLEWLDGIGCTTLGGVHKLPGAGLRRRTGKEVPAALARAYGEAPELFNWVEPPASFAGKLELPDRIEHAEAVLFGARRLLLQLTGWLVARQQAVSRFLLLLEHERGRSAIAPTALEIALADPVWHEEHLTRLLKERLGRLTLAAPVIALRLETRQLDAMQPPTASLFPDPGGTPADYHRLLELLSARLGDRSVLTPAPRADHRPEICNAWVPAGAVMRPAPVPPHHAERPFWLLESPLPLQLQGHRPFYRSPLRMLKGPERIESGWWDGALAVRDYFIARDDSSRLYWIYRERHGDDVRWFLQGLFA